MSRIIRVAAVVGVVWLMFGLGKQWRAQGAEPPGQAAPVKLAEWPEDKVMGEYEGTFTPAKGSPVKAEAKVIAEGVVKGKTDPSYRAVLILAGTVKGDLRGELKGDSVALAGKIEGVAWTGNLSKSKGVLMAEAKGEAGGKCELKRIERRSPTEGQKPPAGAVVLLPYEPGKSSNLDAWTNKTWVIHPTDGSVQVGKRNNLTVQEFGDMRLHVEFMCPYMPDARGQGRGNSGVYSQNRYEVQILDSFGLPPKDNECGGIYQVAVPKVNACLPPGCWQTYDITFRTHRFDAEGKVIEPAKLTVYHNGILIHENQPVMKETVAAGAKGPVMKGPLMLQDHGNPVRYRNIWLIELKD